jgi:hypothetical protein
MPRPASKFRAVGLRFTCSRTTFYTTTSATTITTRTVTHAVTIQPGLYSVWTGAHLDSYQEDYLSLYWVPYTPVQRLWLGDVTCVTLGLLDDY